MESQAQSKSYLKALAKGQYEMKKQRKTWTHCKNLFNRGYQTIKDIIILLLFDDLILTGTTVLCD